MKTFGRADLINGSLVLLFAIQTAVSLFCLVHRAFDIALVGARGPLGVQIPWPFVAITVIVSVAMGVIAQRLIVRTSGKDTTTRHAIGASIWLVVSIITTALLLAFYLDKFTSVFIS